MTDDKKWSLPEDPRQRVNLSKYASFVLENDLVSYGNDMGRSEFICTILKNYAGSSAAALQPNEPFSEKGEAFNIRVSEDAEELLYEKLPQKHPRIRQVYKTAGAFIKTILEEYFRLSASKREQVLFKERLDFFNRMIEEKCAVRINNKTNAFVIRPYKFVVDPITGYNYLIGISRPSRTDAAHDRPVSRRLSAPTGPMLPITSISGKITKEEAAMLDNKLNQVLPAYFMEENTEIVVRFSQRGLQLYNSMNYSRPRLASVDAEEHYHFICTASQARNYFIRLGKEAEILRPDSLRKEMKAFFKQSLDVYTN